MLKLFGKRKTGVRCPLCGSAMHVEAEGEGIRCSPAGRPAADLDDGELGQVALTAFLSARNLWRRGLDDSEAMQQAMRLLVRLEWPLLDTESKRQMIAIGRAVAEAVRGEVKSA